MSWALLVAAALALAAVAPVRWPIGETLSRNARLVLALGAAPVLIVLALFGAARAGLFGDLRLEVRSIELGRRTVERTGLSIGGSDANDVVLPGLPADLITIRREPTSELAVRARLADPDTGVAAAIARRAHRPFWALAAPPPQALGALPFGQGDEICFARCGSPGASLLRLAADGERLEVVGSPGVRLPTLWTRKALGLSGLVWWGPEARIYPLRDFGRPQAGGGFEQDPCADRWLCDARGRPLRSYLFRRGDSAQMWLQVLDDGVRLRRAGRDAGGVSDLTVASWPRELSAEGLDLGVWRVDAAGPQVAVNDEAARPSRWRGGRTLSLRLSPEAVTITPRRGAARGLAVADLDFAKRAAGGEGAFVALQGPGAARGGIATPGVGGLAGTAAFVALSLPPGASGDTFTLAENDVNRAVRFGTPFSVGQIVNGEGTRLTLNIERLSLPWAMVVVALGWAAVAGLATRRLFAAEPVLLVLFTVLQLLLALRWLGAIEAAHLDFRLDWGALGAEAALAYVAAPGLLMGLAALVHDERERTAAPLRWPAPAAIGVFMAAMLAAFPPPDPKAWALPLAALALSALAVAAPFVTWRPAWSFAKATPDAAVRFPWRPLVALAILVAVRLALGLAGFKERMFGVPLSLLYLPLALIAFSAFLAADGGAMSWRRGLAFAAALAAVFFAPAAIHDWGFFIYGLALCFWALPTVRAAWAARRPGEAAIWALPAGGVALALVALCLIPFLGGSARWEGELLHARQLTEVQAHGLLNRLTLTDTNLVRVLAQIDPGRVFASGTFLAEQHRAWSEGLSEYTGSLFGWGWLTPSQLPDAFRVNQLDDNVSAIHVMAPFGRLGAAALLLLLLAQAAWTKPADVPAAAAFRVTLGRICLWTIFAVAAYMMLGNLQLAPFVGKDVYFLAAASNGDLWEGVALYALAVWGLTGVKRV